MHSLYTPRSDAERVSLRNGGLALVAALAKTDITPATFAYLALQQVDPHFWGGDLEGLSRFQYLLGVCQQVGWIHDTGPEVLRLTAEGRKVGEALLKGLGMPR